MQKEAFLNSYKIVSLDRNRYKTNSILALYIYFGFKSQKNVQTLKKITILVLVKGILMHEIAVRQHSNLKLLSINMILKKTFLSKVSEEIEILIVR